MSQNKNILPQGWTAKPINQVFEFIGTSSFSRNDINYEIDDNSIYYIHYGDIHATYKNAVLDFETETRIPVLKQHIKPSTNFLKEGDLIIADASEDYEGIGEALEVYNIENKKVLAGLHTFALRDKNNETAHGYRAYLFKNPEVKKRLKTIATGSKVYGISKGNLEKFQIILPPLPEQQKIAKILSTWDKAIKLQQQLIDNKKQYKKAVMEKLLTGEVRFKGFGEVWKEAKLGKISKIYDGTHSTPEYVKKGIPFYSVENLSKNDFVNTKYISEKVFEKENKRVKLENGDVLMTRIGDIGTSKLLDWDVNASFYVSLALIKKSENLNSLFLEQYIQSIGFQKELFKRTIHVAFPKKINLGEIGDCLIKVPDIEEQTKIGFFLKEINKEINALENELLSFQKQKKGLMQQLLTGKIRVKN